MIFLDTNIVSYIASGERRYSHVIDTVNELSKQHTLAYTAINIMEHSAGFQPRKGYEPSKEKKQRVLAVIDVLFKGQQIHSLDMESGEIAGRFMVECQNAGQNIETRDMLIAAIVQRHGASLVTANYKHFEVFGIPLIPIKV